MPYESYLRFTRVDAVHETASGLVAELHGEQLRVDVIRDDVVRLKMSRGGVFDEQPTYAVCADPTGLGAPFALEAGDDVVRLRTEALTVSLWLAPFRIDVHRPDGSAVIETARDAEGRYDAYATLNDAFTFARRCRPDDAVFGLGEKTGPGNRRGRGFTLWNTDVLSPSATGEFTAGRATTDPRADPTSTEFDPYYVSIPFHYHQDAATGKVSASFVDNGYRAAYDFSPGDRYRVHFSGGQYTEYVFAGPDMPGILEAYTWLTGRTQLPPLWSLGYHQCRWHLYAQSDIEAIAARLREEAIPCDALWLDIEYMNGYRVFTWNEERFPDPQELIKRLDAEGYRLITIVDPGVKAEPGYAVYDDAVRRGVLCRTEGGDVYIGQVWPGNTAFPDFATEEARAWWGELNAAHVASGLAGIWNDMNEPATGIIDPTRMRFDRGRHSHERFHNQYALLMAMGTTQGLLKAIPGRRTFVLSRAGSAGIQRYAANWMGDNLANWDHLALSIPMATGFGISGQAFVGADIGGFFGHTNPELFARWFQYGALTPFCRNHSNIGNRDQYPWSFGEAVLGVVREAVRLRYRLLPYLYASFVLAAETGAPVQRPLVFDHQYDPITADIDDEYLLGPDLLVAPVLAPGVTTRQVYLPEGHWYDWHTGALHRGQRHVVAEAPLDRIPLYARAGAVVPMWADAPPSTDGHAPSAVELHVFVPAEDGLHRSFLQEDDGLTFAAHDGARVRTEFAVTRAGRHVAVRAVTDGAGFDGFARREFAVVLHGAEPARATHDGADVAFERETIRFANSGQGFTLEFEV
ncbi:glycoside hydrolase family 31 protein [Sinomonas sp. JGH33]|uniref:Glycoside hydrolase family 31 protein n=1 Tax=Sinomonas terricola TaxID=3110330 RepID=A0ABU5T8S4_9MICC|nr:TIM-barrel domain-containing protein [Sinomonas sp. JGH33]MEA5455930.1 glycoside hydrolase family 31 protein [Sinomonas sp. JGH33]